MAKLLNLDEITPKVDKVLKIAGKQYKMRPVSVGSFIRLTQELEKYENKTVPLSVQVEQLMGTVKDSFPDIEDEVLKELPLEHLQTIVAFIREAEEAEVEEAVEEEAKKS